MVLVFASIVLAIGLECLPSYSDKESNKEQTKIEEMK